MKFQMCSSSAHTRRVAARSLWTVLSCQTAQKVVRGEVERKCWDSSVNRDWGPQVSFSLGVLWGDDLQHSETTESGSHQPTSQQVKLSSFFMACVSWRWIQFQVFNVGLLKRDKQAARRRLRCRNDNSERMCQSTKCDLWIDCTWVVSQVWK